MIPLSPATRDRLEILFGDDPTARSLLEAECCDNLLLTTEYERIRIAALKGSGGTLDGLRACIALAKQDWRDLLVGAGFADDIHAHLAWKP